MVLWILQYFWYNPVKLGKFPQNVPFSFVFQTSALNKGNVRSQDQNITFMKHNNCIIKTHQLQPLQIAFYVKLNRCVSHFDIISLYLMVFMYLFWWLLWLGLPTVICLTKPFLTKSIVEQHMDVSQEDGLLPESISFVFLNQDNVKLNLIPASLTSSVHIWAQI